MTWATINLTIFIGSLTFLSLYVFSKLNLLQSEGDELGAAIMAFGKAFPGEPIREAQSTIDSSAVFLRLSDGKAGCVQSFKRHVVCRILRPNSVRIHPSDNAAALHVEFGDSRLEDGDFRFRNAQQAAEVSLWLLGSIAADQASRSDPV